MASKLGELGVLPPYYTLSEDMDCNAVILVFTNKWGEVLPPNEWGTIEL